MTHAWAVRELSFHFAFSIPPKEVMMAQTAQQSILTAQNGGVLTVTFNRPEVLNAFNDQMSAELGEALRQAERDASVRCRVLLVSGRDFAAGQDLSPFREREQRPEPHSIREPLKTSYNRIVTRMRELEKPIIAGLNGVAAGVGLS